MRRCGRGCACNRDSKTYMYVWVLSYTSVLTSPSIFIINTHTFQLRIIKKKLKKNTVCNKKKIEYE